MAPDGWTEQDDVAANKLVAFAKTLCPDEAAVATVLATAGFGVLADRVGPLAACKAFVTIAEEARRNFYN